MKWYGRKWNRIFQAKVLSYSVLIQTTPSYFHDKFFSYSYSSWKGNKNTSKGWCLFSFKIIISHTYKNIGCIYGCWGGGNLFYFWNSTNKMNGPYPRWQSMQLQLLSWKFTYFYWLNPWLPIFEVPRRTHCSFLYLCVSFSFNQTTWLCWTFYRGTVFPFKKPSSLDVLRETLARDSRVLLEYETLLSMYVSMEETFFLALSVRKVLEEKPLPNLCLAITF